MSQVLFLCTGNFYRSRYAEILFNYRATSLGLPKRADSRGLMVDVYGVFSVGTIARQSAERLESLGILCPSMGRSPLQLVEDDLTRAELVIAVKAGEHRPMVQNRFPAWEDRITYWDIDDLHDGPAEAALTGIDREIEALLAKLRTPT